MHQSAQAPLRACSPPGAPPSLPSWWSCWGCRPAGASPRLLPRRRRPCGRRPGRPFGPGAGPKPCDRSPSSRILSSLTALAGLALQARRWGAWCRGGRTRGSASMQQPNVCTCLRAAPFRLSALPASGSPVCRCHEVCAPASRLRTVRICWLNAWATSGAQAAGPPACKLFSVQHFSAGHLSVGRKAGCRGRD